MGGKRLTPEQMAHAAKVLAKTGNISDAAREIGVPHSTLRSAFQRERIAKNRRIHAQAIERGLRTGAKQLDRVAGLLAKLLDADDPTALGMEPGDIAKVAQAFNGTVSQRVSISDREERRKQSALTREKTRAEIALLKRKISGEHVERIEVATDDTLDARINELLHGGPPPSDEGSTG
jgi:hypothetical protein